MLKTSSADISVKKLALGCDVLVGVGTDVVGIVMIERSVIGLMLGSFVDGILD